MLGMMYFAAANPEVVNNPERLFDTFGVDLDPAAAADAEARRKVMEAAATARPVAATTTDERRVSEGIDSKVTIAKVESPKVEPTTLSTDTDATPAAEQEPPSEAAKLYGALMSKLKDTLKESNPMNVVSKLQAKVGEMNELTAKFERGEISEDDFRRMRREMGEKKPAQETEASGEMVNITAEDVDKTLK